MKYQKLKHGVKKVTSKSNNNSIRYIQLHTMIFGNVAYRGSFRRRSVVITAGSLTRTVSKPPSISRVTVKPSSVFSNMDANVAYNKMW